MRYSPRTLLVILAIGLPLIAGVAFLPPETGIGLLNLATFLALIAALLCLWTYWPTLTKWL
jgi:hypothetical protein